MCSRLSQCSADQDHGSSDDLGVGVGWHFEDIEFNRIRLVQQWNQSMTIISLQSMKIEEF